MKAKLILIVPFFIGCVNTNTLPYTTKVQTHAPGHPPVLTITFLGNTTLYIKDLTTKDSRGIFIDAFVSRPKYLLSRLSHSKAPLIDGKLKDAGIRIDEVGWVIPLHSHFDHVLDAPYVANKSKGKLLATPTTKNIATSMGYTDEIFYELSGDPIQKISLEAGEFIIELEPVVHSDTGIAGLLYAPLSKRYEDDIGFQFKKKNKAREYVEGQSYNVHITHIKSNKRIYVLGGFPHRYLKNKKLPDALVGADIVFAAVPILRKMDSKDRDFVWSAIATKEKWVVPVHWDVFDRPLDTEQCQSSQNMEKCLRPFFPLRSTMMKMEEELGSKENVRLRWLTAFGKVSM